MRRLRRSSRKTRVSAKRLRVESSESFVRLALPTYNPRPPHSLNTFHHPSPKTLPSFKTNPNLPRSNPSHPSHHPSRNLTRRKSPTRRPAPAYKPPATVQIFEDDRRPPSFNPAPADLSFISRSTPIHPLSAISGLIFEFLASFSSFPYQICPFLSRFVLLSFIGARRPYTRRPPIIIG